MNKIRIYNSLSKKIEDFKPIIDGEVSMYNCGPTVYDYGHIGNFRSFLFSDILRRTFELQGYKVNQVMNLTDVGHLTDDNEDKMLVGAKRLKDSKKSGKVDGIDINDQFSVADFFIKAFIEDAKQVGLKVADEYPDKMPRATNFIPQMQQIIQRLIDRGYAYISDDSVYFDIVAYGKFGQLSGNTLNSTLVGAGGRVDPSKQAPKKNPADFLLWKRDEKHLMKWDSPWGIGYPGWHIECSAMAASVLKQDIIDIHTGGEDNMFPHHECEIAQSCCGSHNIQDKFANYWLHVRYLMVDGKKMAKSDNNFFTVKDLINSGIDPSAIRLELIKTHYQSNLNFTTKGLEESYKTVSKFRELYNNLKDYQDSTVEADQDTIVKFSNALSDNLNISEAMSVTFNFINKVHSNKYESLKTLKLINSVIGINLNSQDIPSDLLDLASQIDLLRQQKDFDQADIVRKRIIELGYAVKTDKNKTTIMRVK